MKTNMVLIALVVLMSFVGVLSVRADSSLTLSETSTSAQIAPRNHWLRPLFGARKTNLYSFDVKSDGGASRVTKVKVRIPTYARMPGLVWLFDGMVQVGSATPNSSTRTADFSGFTLDVPDGGSKTLTVRADYSPAAADTGTRGEYGQVGLVSVTYTTASNTTTTAVPTIPMVGHEQRLFRPMIGNLSLAETPTVVEERDGSGQLTSIYARFVIGFTPEGGDLRMPRAEDFVVLARVGRDEIPCQVSMLGWSVSRIVNGTTYGVGIAARVPIHTEGVSFQRAGAVCFRLCRVTWQNELGSSEIALDQTWGLESFRTVTAGNLPKVDPQLAVTVGRLPKVSTKVWDEISNAFVPDNDGHKGQVVSEGGQILIDPVNPTGAKLLVFPTPFAAKAQIAHVDVVMTSTTMTPTVKAPPDLSVDSREDLADYEVESLSKVRNANQDTEAAFVVTLGSLRMQGKAIRVGPLSCILQFYWDCEEGYPESPGQYLDCLDLSAAFPDVSGGTGRPMRFEIGIGEVSKDANSFRLSVKGAPGAFQVYSSKDMASWSPVYFEYGPMQVGPQGEAGMTGEVIVSSSTLTTPDAPMRFFRLEVR